MSVRRLMGIETEYAISSNSQDPAIRDNPVELSFALIQAAAAARGPSGQVRWDYGPEDPTNDARGYRLPRAAAHPDILTDRPQLRPTNLVATNGGRIYVDHAHPEYSSPEVTSPVTALAYDRAGDDLMQQAAGAVSQQLGRRLVLHRNNTDGKGSSWGAHESYQVKRSVPFETLARLMTAHFVSRQLYAGAGRVGLGERSETPGFQLSGRADFFHARIGLQTTFDRPLINTRDESHAGPDYRRLHVIIGDANRMDVPEVLKLGTTSLLCWLAEQAETADFDLVALLDRVELADPVGALHTVSHDLSLAAPLALATAAASSTTAWQIQVALRTAVFAVAAAVYGTDSLGQPLWPDEDTRLVVDLWGQVLGDLASLRQQTGQEWLTNRPAASRLEWLLKWQVLEGMRRRRDLGWDAPLLAALDLSWADCDPAHSLYAKVADRAQGLISQAERERAAASAPPDSRAWLRAELVNRYPTQLLAAAWQQLVVRGVDGHLFLLDLSDSEQFTEERLGPLLRKAENLTDFLSQLPPEQLRRLQ